MVTMGMQEAVLITGEASQYLHTHWGKLHSSWDGRNGLTDCTSLFSLAIVAAIVSYIGLCTARY